jgi:hypothetical protein
MQAIRRRGIGVGVVLAAICLGPAPLRAAAVSWSVDQGGYWHDAANWTSNPNLPGPSDDVTIDRGPSDITVSFYSTRSESIRSLICNESLDLGLGSLSIAEASQINGELGLKGGSLTGSGEVVVSGRLTWIDGSMTGSGTTQIASAGSMSVTGSGYQYLGRDFANAGLVTLGGSGTFYGLGPGPVFDNQPGATFTIAGDEGLFRLGSLPLLKNAGTLQKTGGVATSTIEWTVNNAGTVLVESGTLYLPAGGSSSGAFQVAPGAGLELGGVHDLSGASINNAGTLRIAGTVHGNPAIDASGSGETQVLMGGALTAKRIRQGQLTIAGSATVAIATTAVANAPDSTSRLGTLAIAGGAAPTASLDLNNNSLIIDYTGPLGNRLSDVTAQIRSGRNGLDFNDQANWNGPGIVTGKGRQENVATAFDLYNLGAINNDDLNTVGIGGAYATFAGQAVTPSAVLVKYTYGGDADLSGTVDGDDYSYWLNGFLGLTDPAVQGWMRGDFNYDGVVDGDDYTQWLNSFLQAGPPLSDRAGPQPVPEPASMALLMVAAGLCLWRILRRGTGSEIQDP